MNYFSSPSSPAYTDPDANGVRISERRGITGWSDPSLKVLWYGELKSPTTFEAAVELRLRTNLVSNEFALTARQKNSIWREPDLIALCFSKQQ